MQSRETFSDSLKIAVVSKYAPAEVRLAIRSSQRFIGDDFAKLKSVVIDYVIGGREFAAADFQGPTSFQGSGSNDMEVDALWKGGKKGKGKDKGKGKHQGKPSWGTGGKQGGKGDKGKGKPGKFGGKSGKAPSKAAATSAFQGECRICGKWGHKANDCWQALGSSRVSAVDQDSIGSSASTLRISELEKELAAMRIQCGQICMLQAAESTAPGVEQSEAWLMMLQCQADASIEAMDKTYRKVTPRVRSLSPRSKSSSVTSHRRAVLAKVSSDSEGDTEAWPKKEAWQKKSRVKKVLFDTGAQVNACRKDFARGGTKVADASTRLFGVGKHEIVNHGRYKVPFDLNGGEIPCSAEWEVSEVSKDVMTAGGLIATGNYSAWLDKDGSYVVNKKDGRRVPLTLENNTFWLEALVAPVDGAAASTAPIEPTEIHLATDAAFPRLYPTEAAAGSTAHAGASSSDEMATSGEDMPPLVDTVDHAPGIGQVVRTPTGLFCGSSVADLRSRLIVLKAPVWGDKATLWKRLLIYEQQNTADKELRSAAEALGRR